MIADVLKQIRLLPYQDMMAVARELNCALPGNVPVQTIADALAEIAHVKVDDSAQTTAEQKLLHQIFARRRSISIKSVRGVFQIELQTLNGAVIHKDLQVGLQQLIDTVVTAQALRG